MEELPEAPADRVRTVLERVVGDLDLEAEISVTEYDE